MDLPLWRWPTLTEKKVACFETVRTSSVSPFVFPGLLETVHNCLGVRCMYDLQLFCSWEARLRILLPPDRQAWAVGNPHDLFRSLHKAQPLVIDFRSVELFRHTASSLCPSMQVPAYIHTKYNVLCKINQEGRTLVDTHPYTWQLSAVLGVASLRAP